MNETKGCAEGQVGEAEQEYRRVCLLLEKTEQLRLCSLAHEPPDPELEAAIEDSAKDLRKALVWAEANDPDILVQLVRGAWFYYRTASREEARLWLQRAITAAAEADATTRGDLLVGLATVTWDEGEYEEADALAQQALSLRAGADAGRRADALILAGNAACGIRDHERAVRLLGEAHSLALETRNDWALRFALFNLGDTHYVRGDLAAAQRFLEDALRHHAASRKTAMAALTRALLGHIAARRGDDGRAEELLRQTISSVINGDADSLDLTYGLEGLAWVATNRGDLERAARLIGAADRIRTAEDIPVQDSERVARDAVESALAGSGSFVVARDEGYKLDEHAAATYALAR
jgi:tetratricopeptide (TPR) repeat protein